VEVESILVEAARAWFQFECRTITVIRHTQTRLHMFNRATVSNIRSCATGKAVDKKVLSTEMSMGNL
jgi:hypothetical protein